MAALGLYCFVRASHCSGFSYCRARLSSVWASAAVARGLTNCSSWASEHRLNVVAHGLRCSVTCGILLDQGSNPCPLHWRADSQPLYYQGSHKTFQLLKLSRIPFYKLCLQLYVYDILTLEKEMATHSSSLAWEIQ